MPSPSYSIIYSARLEGVTTCLVGQVMIPSTVQPGTYVLSTAANRGTRGSEGIALTAWAGPGVGSFDLLQTGIVDASISGLGVAVSKQLVRTSTTGQMERVAVYTVGDDIIGYAELDGRVHLTPGLPWGLLAGAGSIPAGPNLSVQYDNSGVFGGEGEWTRESAGRINITTNGYITYGSAASGVGLTGGLIRIPSGVRESILGQGTLTAIQVDSNGLYLGLDHGGGTAQQMTGIEMGPRNYVSMLAGPFTTNWDAGVHVIASGGIDPAVTSVGVYTFGNAALNVSQSLMVLGSFYDFFAGGAGCTFIGTTSVAPTGNPLNGCLLQFDGSTTFLKYKRPNGTTIVLSGDFTPTGTGFATVTSGVWDSAASAYPLAVNLGGTAIATAGLSGQAGKALVVNGGATGYTFATIPAGATTPTGTGFTTNTAGVQDSASLAFPLTFTKGGTNQSGLGSSLQVLRTNAGATNTEWATLSATGPGGSNTQVQWNNSGAFAGISGITTNGSTELAFSSTSFIAGNGGSSIAATGFIRLAALGVQPVIITDNGSGTDLNIVTTDSTSQQNTYGVVNWNTILTGSTLSLNGNTSTFIETGGSTRINVGTTNISYALPRIGASTPYASEGEATIALSGTAQTLTSAQYSRECWLFTGVNNNTDVITIPAPANADASYFKDIRITSTNTTVNFSTGAGNVASVGANAVGKFMGRLQVTPEGTFISGVFSGGSAIAT